jgi:hypothetical protein
MHEQTQTIERDGQHFIRSGVTGQVLEGPFSSAESAEMRARLRSEEPVPGLEMSDPGYAGSVGKVPRTLSVPGLLNLVTGGLGALRSWLPTPPTPKPEDPLGLGGYFAMPKQALQALEGARQAGQAYHQRQSQEQKELAAWDPLSGEPIPESMLTGGPISTGAMAGVLSRAAQGTRAAKAAAQAVREPTPLAARPVTAVPPPHPGHFTPAEWQFIENVRKKGKVLLPDFSKSEELYLKGKYGENFYEGVRDVFENRLANAELVNQAMKFQTSAALGSEPRAQARIGLEALLRSARGEPMDPSIFQVARDPRTGKAYKVDAKLRGQMLEQLQRIAAGGEPSGPKLLPYGYGMAGDPFAYPMDRHMWDIHFGEQAAAMPPRMLKGELVQPTGRTLESDLRRMLATAEGRERAKQMGIEPRQFQAGQWFGKRGGEDISMADLIVEAIRQKPDEFAKIPGWTRLNEDGQVQAAMAMLLAGGVGGALIASKILRPPAEKQADATQSWFTGGANAQEQPVRRQ